MGSNLKTKSCSSFFLVNFTLPTFSSLVSVSCTQYLALFPALPFLSHCPTVSAPHSILLFSTFLLRFRHNKPALQRDHSLCQVSKHYDQEPSTNCTEGGRKPEFWQTSRSREFCQVKRVLFLITEFCLIREKLALDYKYPAVTRFSHALILELYFSPHIIPVSECAGGLSKGLR